MGMYELIIVMSSNGNIHYIFILCVLQAKLKEVAPDVDEAIKNME